MPFSFKIIAACVVGLSVAACTAQVQTPGSTNLSEVTSATPTTGNVGGSIAQGMDAEDKLKLSRALDSAPGKTTRWTNLATGLTYTVVPVRKITVAGNPFCREYNLTATRNEQSQQLVGNACVGADGSWHPIS